MSFAPLRPTAPLAQTGLWQPDAWQTRLNEAMRALSEIWYQGLFGVDISRVLIALGIFVGFLVIRGRISAFIVGRITRRAERRGWTLGQVVAEALAGPLRMAIALIGFAIATDYLAAQPAVETVLRNINQTLAAILVFWTLANLVTPVAALIERRNRRMPEAMLSWISRAVRTTFILIGLAAVLEVWGIRVGPLIAGLGLFGVAIALGAQDLFKNLIAGLFLISERRFNNGDWVLVEGVAEGTVELIGFRTTMIRRFDQAPVYVPNAQMSDSAVINFSRMRFRRIRWIIGVEYATTREQLETIRDGIERYIIDCGDFEISDRVNTFVRIDGFAASSIDILVYCFTKSTVWRDWLGAKERLALHIKETVEAAGAGFAFPSQSVYVETLPERGPGQTAFDGAARTARHPAADAAADPDPGEASPQASPADPR
ncbi:mechanosensitive ion channel family protein [Rhodothalassium salexigens]|uniref:mechanosensitive ion channel family protein n=1 Tax=Rhodothalassium salexigens TaxID=1086 RepID=UPI0019136E6E|nr:mechanosensitive ion channel family protein [Rhodothalassium salexigens]